MREMLLFLGQIVRGWRTTGAVAPSGARLARRMAEAVGAVDDGQVILELGPGTGVFTRELVRRFPSARVIAVEVNDAFASHLRATVPSVTVVTGCASLLADHLESLGLKTTDVAAVVSGLPLLSLPGELPRQVLASVASVLPSGRRYVQFTYSERAWRKFNPNGFQRHPHQRVWRNLPPAVVLSFTRDERTDRPETNPLPLTSVAVSE